MKMRNPYAASNVQRGGGEPFIANPNVLDSLGQSSVEISERETSKSLEWTKESECSFSASISAQSKQKKQFSEQQPAVDAASIVASKKPYGVSHPLQTNATSSTQHIVGARKSTDDTLGNTATNNPLMTQLLPQLRIFQREALEFAVDGKHYERQFMAPNAELLRTDDGGSIGKQSSVRISAADSRSNSSIISNTYDCFPVGQGRILLADEMGLGA